MKVKWTESAYGHGKVDKKSGVIHDVKILGLQSRNGRSYLPEATRAAVKLYEGAKVFLNHPSRDGSGERDVRDRWGILENVRVDGNGELWGDLKYLKSHRETPQILEAIDLFPSSFGLSHNAEGEEQRQDGKKVVTTISEVYSVDLVADPATNKGLFESRKMPITIAEAVKGTMLQPALARLLEMEGYEDMGGMEMMEGDEEDDSAESHLEKALVLMVTAIVKDPALDMRGKMERLKKVLMVQDTLTMMKGDSEDQVVADEEGVMEADEEMPDEEMADDEMADDSQDEEMADDEMDSEDESATVEQSEHKPSAGDTTHEFTSKGYGSGPTKKRAGIMKRKSRKRSSVMEMEGDPQMANAEMGKEDLRAMAQENKKMKEELSRFRAEAECKELLEQYGREVTQVRVRALACCRPEDRVAIVESWTMDAPRDGIRVVESRRPARSPGSASAASQYPDSTDDFKRQVRS